MRESFSLSGAPKVGRCQAFFCAIIKSMNIAFGHSNMDFDCFGSLVLVKKLFPDYNLVRSSRIIPAAQLMCDFFDGYFNFIGLNEISDQHIENIIIVDTCMSSRVKEYFNKIRNPSPKITIYDHHRTEQCDFPDAELVRGNFGSTTSLLAKLAMKKNLKLGAEEATIALTAIYADTGRLIYENVTPNDYEAAAWLLNMGASLKLVKSFLETVKADEQIDVLGRLKPDQYHIQGHRILLSYIDLDENIAGLAAVVDKLMEIHSPDAYFAVFSIPKDDIVLLIARGKGKTIDMNALLSIYGGGGHELAASARISGKKGREFFNDFYQFLTYALEPAARASDIMTKNVFSIHENTTLKEASMFLERLDISAVPIMDKEGKITGLISLRDIMKGRKNEKMHVPVTAYMSKPVIFVDTRATVREIEQIFFKNKISHLPVLEEGKLQGIVSRWDYLQYMKQPADELIP